MTYYQIPTSAQNTHYTQTVSLSGTLYQLELRYNGRMGRWILNINTPGGAAIVSGVPMLAMRPLTSQYTTLSVPPGTLFCLNFADPSAQPTLASFLTDTGFFYKDKSP